MASPHLPATNLCSSSEHLAYLDDAACFVNLGGDYRYMTSGHYTSQDLEATGATVHPTCKEILDGYIMPLSLERARLAGLRVIDDPDSIIICCDKVHIYRYILRAGLPMLETIFLQESDLTQERDAEFLERMGRPLVLKAPNSSFSLYVERVSPPRDFVRVGRRFLRRADRMVVQQFVRSEFDWRVGVFAGEVLYVCRYGIPKKHWKILPYTVTGRVISGRVQGFDIAKVSPKLLETAIRAASAIRNGVYAVDLKQLGDDLVVIKVNDDPTIAEGEEDQRAPRLYERLIRYLAGDWG